MENSVLKAIEDFSLLDGSKSITVALSGGADSMALLYVLHSLKDELEIELSAAHLNHMIRGEEAFRDEEFVKEQCEILGVPLYTERIDVPKIAAFKKISTELAAREARYEFLKRVSKGSVATAHTASDNLETIIYNLTRGTALKGLCGIPPKRDRFIRPLILSTRAQIEEYCEQNNIPFVTDSTNLTDEYTRNNIRHNVIPVLKGINPSVEKAAIRTATALSEDDAFLEELAQKFICDNAANGGLKVSNMPSSAVFKRAIKQFANMENSELSLDSYHIGEIIKISEKGGKTSLPLSMLAIVENGILRFLKEGETDLQKQFYVETQVKANDLFNNGEKINNLLLNNLLDCDKIMGKSVLRTRQSGDKIRLSGRNCTKTLTKLMSELNIPINERDKLPLIADDNGVIWIYGIGVAARCAVTKKTKQIMIIKASDVKNIKD